MMQSTGPQPSAKFEDRWHPHIIQSPTATLQRAAALLDEGVRQLLAALASVDQSLRIYESSHDCLNLLYLSIRHVDSVVVLATTDIVLWSPGITLARAALESSVRALWMVSPTDPFEREARWLSYLKDEVETRERHNKRQSKETEVGRPSRKHLEEATDARSRFETVQRLLAGRSHSPGPMPKFDAMLKQTKVRSPYSQYIIGSQFAHGTLWATWAFRGRDWKERSGQEARDEVHWQVPLALCGTVIVDSARTALRQLGVAGKIFRRNYEMQMERAISRVGQKNREVRNH
jgi:hypothetical protein